jgi:UDP-2,3-diacylglucosamine pyrophosphatase LpxH
VEYLVPRAFVNPVEYFRDDVTRTVEDGKEQYPELGEWSLRQAYRDARRAIPSAASDVDTLSTFVGSDLSPTARALIRAGVMRPLLVDLPDLPAGKPTFKRKGDHTTGVINDLHAGADSHCPHALDLFIQIGRAVGLDRLIMNGDMMDVGSLSRFSPSSEVPMRWAEERVQAIVPIAKIAAAFPDAEKIWHHGNHDVRPERFIASQAPQLQGLFSLNQYLGIDQFDFVYPEKNRTVLYDQVLVKHGTMVSKNAGYSVMREVMEHGMSVLMGHVHRKSYAATTKTSQIVNGDPHLFGIENGCLCNLDPSYIEEENTANWQHSATILTYFEKENLVIPECIEIHGRVAVFRGQMFVSRAF